jgi:signal transduction histidine kinase
MENGLGRVGKRAIIGHAPEAVDAGRIPGEVADEAILRVCHDLVTPAVTIRYLAEAIEDDPDASADLRRLATLIAAESTAISDICAFVLDTSQKASPVRLDWIVSDCVSSASAWFRGTINERVDPVTLSAQRVPMLRLVSNLLNNACNAAGPDGEVRVTLENDELVAHLDVANTGARLEPELLTGTDGSGTPSTLGLRIVSGILTEYHGQLKVEPGRLGGTTVHVRLPLGGFGDVSPPSAAWAGVER